MKQGPILARSDSGAQSRWLPHAVYGDDILRGRFCHRAKSVTGMKHEESSFTSFPLNGRRMPAIAGPCFKIKKRGMVMLRGRKDFSRMGKKIDDLRRGRRRDHAYKKREGLWWHISCIRTRSFNSLSREVTHGNGAQY